MRSAELRREHHHRADEQEARLEAGHRHARVVGVRAAGVRQRDRQQHEAGGHEGHAENLPPTDLEAEEALGEHREEHEAAGDDRLHERQRRQRHGRHVEAPRAGGHQHAEGEPLGAVQRDGAADGVAPVDRRGGARSLVLPQEAEVRGQRAEQRQQDA
jgi:hypothetical protein